MVTTERKQKYTSISATAEIIDYKGNEIAKVTFSDILVITAHTILTENQVLFLELRKLHYLWGRGRQPAE